MSQTARRLVAAIASVASAVGLFVLAVPDSAVAASLATAASPATVVAALGAETAAHG